LVFPSSFLSVFSPSVLFCCLLVASIMSESSCCFQTCTRNSVCRLVVILAYSCTVWSWWSQLQSCYHTWSCWWSHNKWKSVTFVYSAYVQLLWGYFLSCSSLSILCYSCCYFCKPLSGSLSLTWKEKFYSCSSWLWVWRFLNAHQLFLCLQMTTGS
jgi:hypothetical protein